MIGLQVGVLFTGAILTETIFSWPGVGKWLIEAINRRDYPVLQGGMLLLGVVVMLVNLLVDVTYGIINPRIRQLSAMSDRAARHRRPCRDAARRPARWREFWGYFQRQPRRGGRASSSSSSLLLVALFAPWLAPHAPDLTNSAAFLQPPAWQAGGSCRVSCSAPTRSAATSFRG